MGKINLFKKELFSNLKNQLDEEPNDGDWKRFINNTRASDKFRKVDILNYIPWMEEHM